MKKLLLPALLLGFISAKATNYFVKNGGNDAANGRTDSTAWATLSKVGDFALNGGDTVFFKCGSTWHETLTIKRSGTSNNPIVFDAYSKGTLPAFSGFTNITLWKVAGINLWKSPAIPGGLPGILKIVAKSEVPLGVGRFPDLTDENGGYLKIDSGRNQKTAIYDAALPAKFNFTNASVVIRAERWILDIDSISYHNTSKHIINYTQNDYKGSTYAPHGKNWGYFIQNDSNTLTTQNEWYYSRANKWIKMYSAGTPANIGVSTLSTGVSASSGSWLTFMHLAIKGYNDFGFNIQLGSNINITGCEVTCIGNTGIEVTSDNFNAEHNIVHYCMNTGIETKGNYVNILSNDVRHIYTIAGMGKSGDGQGNGISLLKLDSFALVQYNTVVDVGFCGISFKNDAAINNCHHVSILNNYLDSCLLVKDDGGFIYTFQWNNGTNTAREIKGNICKGRGIGSAAFGTNTTASSAHGIYLDVQASDILIRDNYIDSMGRSGMYWHAGNKRLIVTNNTFFNNGLSVDITNSDSTKGCQLYINQDARPIENNIIKNNIFWATGSHLLVQIDGDSVAFPTVGVIDSNYYVNYNTKASPFRTVKGKDSTNHSFASWKSITHFDEHSSQRIITSSNILQAGYSEFTPATIYLQGHTWTDARNVAYGPRNLTLPPWTSIILVQDTNIVLPPLADAFVRDGPGFSGINFGSSDSLQIKKNSESFNRVSYLKFSLKNLTGVASAKLRIYGKNTANRTTVNVSAYGIPNNLWTENGITWNNKPAVTGSALDAVGVNDSARYYELDVSSYVIAHLADSVVSFVLKDTVKTSALVSFNSREAALYPPRLVVVTPVTVSPLADAFVRDGAGFATTNFGNNDSLEVKKNSASFNRLSYLKFPLRHFSKVTSAKLRVYGKNTVNKTAVNVVAYGMPDNSWSENGITWNNKPAITSSALDSVNVNDSERYYEFDVSSYVISHFLTDSVISFVLKDTVKSPSLVSFNSKEKGQYPPLLVISEGVTVTHFMAGEMNKPGNLSLPVSIVNPAINIFDKVFLKPAIYPNPVHKSFVLAFPNNYREEFSIQMTDVIGRTWDLGKQKFLAGVTSTKINIGRLALPPGIYYLKINASAGKSEVIKMIVE